MKSKIFHLAVCVFIATFALVFLSDCAPILQSNSPASEDKTTISPEKSAISVTQPESIRITEIVTIVALFLGPLFAVWLGEYLRNSEDAKKRKIHIFRILMATRTTPLYGSHIEALNQIEIEFHSNKLQEQKVIGCWRLYRAHLDNLDYIKKSPDAWTNDKSKLLIDILYEMSVALGYSFTKSQIEKGVYYPQVYQEIENENAETRKLWLEVLRGKRQIPMKAEVFTNQPPPTKPPETN